MRSAVHDILPLRLRRSLRKLGKDLSLARRKRRLTLAMLSERVGVSKSTCTRVEKGDPSVAMGVYAMVTFVLGLGDRFFEAMDPAHDEFGMQLSEEYIPKRVRRKKDAL